MSHDIVVTSMPDSDRLIAEIYFDGENVATLIEGDSPNVEVEIYAGMKGEPYRVDYNEFIMALLAAHQKLVRLNERRPD